LLSRYLRDLEEGAGLRNVATALITTRLQTA
jgi:hypothetical protein